MTLNILEGQRLALTVPEAARRYGTSPRLIRRAVADGELASFQIGKWRRIRIADLEEWVAKKVAIGLAQ